MIITDLDGRRRHPHLLALPPAESDHGPHGPAKRKYHEDAPPPAARRTDPRRLYGGPAIANAGAGGLELMTDLHSGAGRNLPAQALGAPGLAGRTHPVDLARAQLQIYLPGAGGVVAQRERLAEGHGRVTSVDEFRIPAGTIVSLTARTASSSASWTTANTFSRSGRGPAVSIESTKLMRMTCRVSATQPPRT